MSEENQFYALADHAHIGQKLTTEDLVGLNWVYGELARLRSLATRWYLADGSFETLPEEEVIRRRKEAAKVLARYEDAEGIRKVVREATERWWKRSPLDRGDDGPECVARTVMPLLLAVAEAAKRAFT